MKFRSKVATAYKKRSYVDDSITKPIIIKNVWQFISLYSGLNMYYSAQCTVVQSDNSVKNKKRDYFSVTPSFVLSQSSDRLS